MTRCSLRNLFWVKFCVFAIFFVIFCDFAYAGRYLYRASLAPDLKNIAIELCLFDNIVHGNQFSLTAFGDNAGYRISDVSVSLNSDTVNILQNKNTITFNNITDKSCIRYRAQLHNDIMLRLRVKSSKNQILTDPSEWLWYPTNFSESDSIQIQFTLANTINVSSPWHLITRSKKQTSYKIVKRPMQWQSLVVFGEFDVSDIKLGDSVLRYALINGPKEISNAKIRTWFDRNITALTRVYGDFPVMNLQILIVPLNRGAEPVPWGQVKRGGGDAVHLYIDETQSLQQFLDDWVLSHELSHLLHPKMWGQGAWLYEGLASYYQNVIRARSGLLSAKQAWGKLDSGFERGLKNTVNNKTLTEVTETMMQSHSFMRVYWSGAAIFLLADINLRKYSKNNQSLDSTLKKFRECCFVKSKWWTALEFMQQMDVLSSTTVFTDLYHQYAHSVQFPDLKVAYLTLGLDKKSDRLIYRNNQSSTIRDAIMSGKNGTL